MRGGLGAQDARSEGEGHEAVGARERRPRRRRGRPRARRARRPPRRASGSSSSAAPDSPSHGTSRSPGHGAATRSSSGTGASTAGTRVRPDCFAAATAMRRQRSRCAPCADDVRRHHRREPLHAELRRLLDHEVHLRSPCSSAGASTSSSGDSRDGRRAGDDAPDRLARADPLEHDLVLAARVVEDAQARARGEPQGAQVAQLGARDADLPGRPRARPGR